MTESKNKPAKSPSHIAYNVREGNGDKKIWTRIGSAWPHADGNGFNIRFENVPLDGLIMLRVPSKKSK